MFDDLTGLTTFLAVAERRSFSAAAAAMRVTPSAVSQTLRNLEERLGVRLLQRTTRSVGLTEAGERFRAQLLPAMEGVRSAFESLGRLRDTPSGTLRLTLPRIGYERILEPKLDAFLSRYPEVSLDLSIDDAFVDIVQRGFDAGLRIGEAIDREMIAVRVSGDLRMAVVGSPAYFAAHGRPKHPRELKDHQCIAHRDRALGGVYRWEFTERGRDFSVGVQGRVMVNDGEAMRRAALSGHGLAYLFDDTVREDLASRRLVRVLDAYCVPFPGFFLYYPSRAQLAPKLQALVDVLRVTPSARARGARGGRR